MVIQVAVDTSGAAGLPQAKRVFFLNLKLAVQDTLAQWQSEHARRFLAGRPGVFRRTGALARSVKWSVVGNTMEDLVGIGYAGTKYAGLQEFGGVVIAKDKFLAIPLKDALTPAGVSRYPSPIKDSIKASGKFPGGSFVARSKAGNLIVFGRLGKSAKGRQKTRGATIRGAKVWSAIVPLFVLKRSVAVPPRLGLRQTWRDLLKFTQTRIRNAFAASVQMIAGMGKKGAKR